LRRCGNALEFSNDPAVKRDLEGGGEKKNRKASASRLREEAYIGEPAGSLRTRWQREKGEAGEKKAAGRRWGKEEIRGNSNPHWEQVCREKSGGRASPGPFLRGEALKPKED